jgi:hypothetical protein
LLQALTIVSSAARVTDAATTTVSQIVGIAQATAAAGDSVEIAANGNALCIFDGTAIAAGDFVQISSTTAGDCHDAGTARPTTGQIVGFALTSGGAGTTQTVRLFESDIEADAVIIGGNSGSDTVNNCFMGIYSSECSPNEADVQLPIPRGGRITNFNYRSFTGGTPGDVIVLRVDGSNTNIGCTTGIGGSCSDLSDTAIVTAGQAITINATSNVGKRGSWSAQIH